MAIPYWRLSGFYFFYFAAVGGLVPYWSLYLQHMGFGPAAIGQLSALLVSTKIIAPNFWGWFADRTGKCMAIIRLASLLAAALFAGFFYADGYLEFAVTTVAFSFFWNAALPQFEAATLFHLRKEPQRYGKIRLWGSVGFIVAVVGVGQLFDHHPPALLPALVFGLLLANFLTAALVPEAAAPTHGHAPARLWPILGKPGVLAFFVVNLLLQVAHAPYYVFYSMHLQSSGYSATLTGGLWALGVVAEIILFLLIKPLLARFSPGRILLASALLAVARWTMIAWGTGAWPVLALAQLLHAATFGSTHIAAIHLLSHYFGTRHQGMGQALYGSLSLGLGGMAGSALAGHYWQPLGAPLVYALCAMLCCLASLLAFVFISREKAAAPPA